MIEMVFICMNSEFAGTIFVYFKPMNPFATRCKSRQAVRIHKAVWSCEDFYGEQSCAAATKSFVFISRKSVCQTSSIEHRDARRGPSPRPHTSTDDMSQAECWKEMSDTRWYPDDIELRIRGVWPPGCPESNSWNAADSADATELDKTVKAVLWTKACRRTRRHEERKLRWSVNMDGISNFVSDYLYEFFSISTRGFFRS